MSQLPLRRFFLNCAAGAGILLIVGSAQWANARIGETKEQIAERYDTPLRESEPIVQASEGAEIYFKDNVEVTVEFKRGKAWLVSYRTNTMKTELEAELRDANDGVANGVGDWKDPLKHLGRVYWVTEDKEIYGVRYDTGNSKIYRFCNRECREAMEIERKQKIKDAKPGEVEPPAGDAEEGKEGDPGF